MVEDPDRSVNKMLTCIVDEGQGRQKALNIEATPLDKYASKRIDAAREIVEYVRAQNTDVLFFFDEIKKAFSAPRYSDLSVCWIDAATNLKESRGCCGGYFAHHRLITLVYWATYPDEVCLRSLQLLNSRSISAISYSCRFQKPGIYRYRSQVQLLDLAY
jgi:hypothetical protein